MRVRSVRSHVLAWLLGASAFGALVLVGTAYLILRDEQNEVLDANLRAVALAAAQARVGAPEAPRPVGGRDADGDAERVVIASWDASGARRYLSDASVPLRRPDHAGLERQTVGSEAWDAFAVIDDGGTTVAAQRAFAQEARAAESASSMLLPLSVLTALLAVLLLLALRRGLAPLHEATAALAARSEVALDPLPERSLPRELRPLVRAMNQLLARMAGALDAQRTFVADAAHELRTPISVLRLQHQLAMNTADPAAREQALRELGRGIERIQHLGEQLLALSRADPAVTSPTEHRAVALADLAAQVVSDLDLIADRAGIDLGLQRADDATVQGNAAHLRTLLTNLVDNALHYTPRGGVVDVAVVRDAAGGVELSVGDSGPGIEPAERERVFSRFVRGRAAHAPDHSAPGSGLGLAIVQAIADGHHARVTLHDSPRGGLLVRVRFAPSAPEALKPAGERSAPTDAPVAPAARA